MSDLAHISVSQGVATITLENPPANGYSYEMMKALDACVLEARMDAEVHAIILTGAGEKFFCAGADINMLKAADPVWKYNFCLHANETLSRLEQTPKLVIAAINGHCVGGGLLIAAACDLRLASENVRFSIPEVDLGIPLAWGGIPRMVREFGPAITKELVLTCRPFGAEEAHSLRFLNRVVPGDELVAAAEALAAELASKPGFSLRATKTQVNAVMDEIAGVGRNANDAHTLTVALHDPESQAASRAYLESRGK